MTSAVEAARRAAGLGAAGAPPRLFPNAPPRRQFDLMRARSQARAAGFQRGIAQRGDRGPKPKSILGQFGDIVGGLPRGLIGLTKDVATDVVAPVRIAVDAVQGDVNADVSHYMPFIGSTGSSLKRTGHRIGQGALSLAPGGLSPSDTEYAKAVREGGIVGAGIEDLGNLAIVGAVVSGGTSVAAGRAGASAATKRAAAEAATKAAPRVFAVDTAGEAVARYAPKVQTVVDDAARATERAARLRAASGQIRGASRKLDAAADAPARVFTVPAKAIAKAARPALRPAVERLGETAIGQAARAAGDNLAERRAARRTFTEEVLDPLNEERLAEGRRVGLVAREAEKSWRQAAETTGYPQAALEEAQILRANGVGPQLVRTLRQVEDIGGPELRDRVMREAVGIETTVSDEALDILGRELDGDLPPEHLAAMDEAWSWTDRKSVV